MSNSDDPLQTALEALAKQLPVRQLYDDAVSPAAKQAGLILADIAKTIRLALVPFQLTGVAQDRIARFLDRAVQRVPESNRISPAPQILGPTLEGIRYEEADSPIDQMFSELLSRSMDSSRVDEAHPAYPVLIKQLSPDEARILALLNGRTYRHVHTRDYDSKTSLFVGPPKIEVDDLPRDALTFPNRVGFYMEHLNGLGLAGIFQEGNQEPLSEAGKQIGIRVISLYRLTNFGHEFVRACTILPSSRP